MSSHQSSLTQNHCSTLEKHKTQTLQNLFASAEVVAAHKKTKNYLFTIHLHIQLLPFIPDQNYVGAGETPATTGHIVLSMENLN